MIPIAKYQVQIDINGLYDLLFQKRYDQEGEQAPDQAQLEAALAEPEAQARSIIVQRFGHEPAEPDFLQAATVAGVIYLLSRKPGNTVSQDQIDQRRQTFFDMLPAAPGSDSRAEVQSRPSKLGDWL